MRKKLSTSDLIFKQLQARSLEGNLGAKKLLDQLRAKYQQEDEKPELRGIFIPPAMELDEWQIYANAQRKRMLWAQANRE